MIGEVRAAGKSTQVLERELAAKLGDGYLINPQVIVTVKEFKSQKVFVMGEVKNPGTYPVTRENNLLFVLSQAGGHTKEAGDKVVIIRPQNPGSKRSTLHQAESFNEKIIEVSLKEVLAGDRKANMAITEGGFHHGYA